MWVEEVFSKFKTRSDKVQARSKGTQELKVLFEESYPLSLYIKQLSSKVCEKIEFMQRVGNQNYDVEVYNCDEYEFIEITQAINGEIDAMRMLQLNLDGQVSASGSVWKKGKENQGNLILKFEGDSIIDDMKCLSKKSSIELIEIAILKKVKKNYPINTILLITFDDHIDAAIGSDLNYLGIYMRDTASMLIGSTFSKAYLVGLSGKTFFST